MMRARTAVLLAMGCGIALGAWAGDGIPMGNAVFYPSIEAVYTSTDNLYLQDGTMPNGNESGHFWAIRPTVGFEFPFKESYVRLDIGYQYQDYSSNYNLASHNQYTGNLKGVFKFGNGNSFTIEDGFIHGVQEVTKFDPGYETYYSNTPFNANALRMGLDFALNKLNTLGVYGIYNTVSFTDVNYAFQQPFYDYHQVAGGLLWKYNYRPAANFLLDVRYLENRPDQAWSAQFFNAYNARKYDQWQALTGIEGDLSQVVSGFVKLGWSSMKFSNDYSNFNGFVGDLGLRVQGEQVLRGGPQGAAHALPVGLQREQLLHRHGRRAVPPLPGLPLLLRDGGVQVPGERLPRRHRGLPLRHGRPHDPRVGPLRRRDAQRQDQPRLRRAGVPLQQAVQHEGELPVRGPQQQHPLLLPRGLPAEPVQLHRESRQRLRAVRLVSGASL